MSQVIVISGDSVIRDRSKRALESAGIDVCVAECGVSGLERVWHEGVCLFLCDDVLPDMTVFDLLNIKRSEPVLADIPVIVSASQSNRAGDYYNAGCDDFILLPFQLSDLANKVRAVLRRSHARGVTGSFSHISILDLIQMLMNAHRDGRLDVDCGAVYGTLYFEMGQIVSAISGELVGEDAFLQLLRVAQKGGDFNFTADADKTGTRNITQRTDHLLLGLANVLDEEG